MSDEGGESCEELLNLLHQRMISTGEWSSTLSQMRRMLEERGWETQLREQAESRLIPFMVIYFYRKQKKQARKIRFKFEIW